MAAALAAALTSFVLLATAPAIPSAIGARVPHVTPLAPNTAPPIPEVQTPAQARAFARISAAAQPASAAAMADVFALLGSAAVQSGLKQCCPSLAGVAP